MHTRVCACVCGSQKSSLAVFLNWPLIFLRQGLSLTPLNGLATEFLLTPPTKGLRLKARTTMPNFCPDTEDQTHLLKLDSKHFTDRVISLPL